ncbi:hypothetical protein V6N13_046722 [Hibiscus sabdariffa]|uniref:Mur ligase C-terminal domain-containing protein n=2 Tax=Hibiscus sabdariffa TaxID=183260 RepID=A0ABR2P0B3_9ROSI
MFPHRLGLHLTLISLPGLAKSAAAAVVTSIVVPLSRVGRSLSGYVPASMRSELFVAKSGVKIVNDVYNSNPVSTKSAIDMSKRINNDEKRVAILGDILELGPLENIVNYCLNAHIDVVGY